MATPTWGMLDQQALIPFPSCGECKPGKVGEGPVAVLASMGSAVHMPLLDANSGSRASMNKGKPMSDLTG